MKSGWEIKKLGNVCTIKPPKAEARKKISHDALVSFVPMEDLGIDEKVFKSTQKRSLSEVVGSYTYFADGDVLLPKITPCFENGKLGIAAGLANGVGFGSSEYIVLRPDERLNKEWLYYFLSRETFRLEGAQLMTGAVGHKRVPKEFIENYPIPFPPLPEQQRIISILDETFDGIATAKANAEKNIKNARQLFDSHLNSVFSQRGEGWVEKQLQQTGITQTGSTPKTLVITNYGEYIPFVKPADFNKDGSLDYDKDKLSKPGFEQARKISAGSVLMVCIGATIGKCGYCDRDVTSNQQINSYTPFDAVDHKFIFYQMLTRNFQQRVIQNSAQATLPIINKSKWSSLNVWLPPDLTQQRQIVVKLDILSDETQRLESIYQNKIEALDALKKSIQQKAFSGKL